MNDIIIRQNFHKKVLNRHHSCNSTLVIDELGLKHGKCRADIVVINGHLSGFEIKSDKDSLSRLFKQINIYNHVFDHATIVVGPRHFKESQKLIPDWWGIILCSQGRQGAISFKTVRRPKLNKNIDPKSIAELLWKNEAEEILQKRGLSGVALRQRRSILYEYLADMLSLDELRKTVRCYLTNRTNWRCPVQPFLNGDSSQLVSM